MKCPFHVFIAGASFSTVFILASLHINGIMKKKSRMHEINTDMVPSELLNTVCPYSKEISEATGIILLAGSQLKSAIDDTNKLITNKGDVDFVTETDKSIEELIFNHLKRKFPSHKFIGEESASSSKQLPPLSDDPTWIVDPIDGTTNFVHRFPFTCVSMALVVNREVVVGVVYDPIKNEVFHAMKGHGAYLNKNRINVSKVESLNKALVMTDFGYQRDPVKVKVILECVNSVLMKGIHSLRIMGSGVLDLCYVGCGRLDAVYAGVAGEGWYPWDYAAGSLIIEEAGGVILTAEGKPFHLYSESVLAAATPVLASELVRAIAE